MKHLFAAFCVLLCVLAISAKVPAQTLPSAKNPEAQKILDEIQNLKRPVPDMSRRSDEQYVQSFMNEQREYMTKVATLAKQFNDKYPDEAAAADLMALRWMILLQSGDNATVTQETTDALAKTPTGKPKANILFFRAVLAMNSGDESASAAVETFIQEAPKDERGAELLAHEAEGEQDSQKQLALFRRIIQLYPDSPTAATARGSLRQIDDIGKPFELAFTDAIGGKKISVQKDLKGKVVVIDFWATWCGPCVGEMPKNKELYAQFKDKGVEFIGVSLDRSEAEGGLKALKDFVAANEITWPQYYQGNYWQSEFSAGWGIDSIPAVFVVDADGKLNSTTARGQLETILPNLIAKRDQAH